MTFTATFRDGPCDGTVSLNESEIGHAAGYGLAQAMVMTLHVAFHDKHKNGKSMIGDEIMTGIIHEQELGNLRYHYVVESVTETADDVHIVCSLGRMVPEVRV